MNKLSYALVITLLFLGACRAPSVEVTNPEKGLIRESFTEQAKTRLDKTYLITMPIGGRIGRIELEPSDKVEKGQELAQYDLTPFRKELDRAEAAVKELKARIVVKDDNSLERTALVEARSAIEASNEALKASREQVQAERARWKRAVKELDRMSKLLSGQAIPQSMMDDVVLREETALIELKRQEFYLAAMKAIVFAVKLGPVYVNRYVDKKELERKALEHQLAQAKARYELARHNLELARIISPIDGTVLRRHEQGAGPLPAGKPLLLLGRLEELEAVAQTLTQDALKLKPGDPVELTPSDSRAALKAQVKRIEPAGFTKLSSLGVEQQRVNVIVKFIDPHPGLGTGYRVQAKFFTAKKDNALLAPRFSVMQEPDGRYYLFSVKDGRLKKRIVKIGLRSDFNMEIKEGLTEKDLIVARPDTTMIEGMKVETTPLGD
jgi:HlyD family secretion protein